MAITDDSLPWVEKYRPSTLDDVVSHQDITSTIRNFIKKNRLPHLLLYGPPGTGKTSMILAMARELYGADYRKHILELNASDDRGIDVVREQIKDFADSGRLFKGHAIKLIILDEADMMTQTAQAALRRIVEQYTKNVRFCILCNYVNKIIPAIQSRCTRFRFSPLPPAEVRRRLEHVIDAERATITTDGFEALLALSRGDMRRALNVLQACHAAFDNIDEEAVYLCTGHPRPADIELLMQSMLQDDFTTCVNTLTKVKTDRGLALQDILTAAYSFIDEYEFPSHSKVYLLDQLSVIEYRLSSGGNERLQLSGLIAAIKLAVQMSQLS